MDAIKALAHLLTISFVSLWDTVRFLDLARKSMGLKILKTPRKVTQRVSFAVDPGQAARNVVARKTTHAALILAANARLPFGSGGTNLSQNSHWYIRRDFLKGTLG
jgi:hypothetical protein